MHFLSSHRRTMCFTPKSPKGWLRIRIFTYFCVVLHIFVAGNRRHFKFGMPIDHSKSQPIHNKLSLNWVWSRDVIHFKFQGPKHT